MTKKNILSFIITLFVFAISKAQVDKNSKLYKTILSKDSLLFNVGFNTCDIKQYENLLSDNLKFYHDKDGISDKTKFLYDLKNGLCKSPETRQVKRFLVKESTEIFPLYRNGVLYGAIQNGKHLFYENKESEPGSAKFSNVWMLENGDWKLTTSLSFGHQAYEIQKIDNSIFDNDKEIEKWLKSNNIPALGLGVINEGKLQQIKVYGDLIDGESAPYNTIFNVASLTKPVTAIVALKLVSLGKWDLDEPIYKYWTDQDVADDPRSKKLTTRHILSHQTGFPNWRYLNKSKKLNFQFEPGTQYQYSGEGLEYLRKALENKFKKTLNQLAKELIFDPLAMTDTQYIWDDKIDESRLALGYDNKGNAYETVKNKTANGADDLLTTVEDYGKFLVSVMNSIGLSKKVFEDMVTHQVTTKKGKHIGLGFEIYNFKNGDYALSHSGADNGVQAIAFIFPKTKKGLIIFTNVDNGYKIYKKIITHYLGEQGKEIIEIEKAE
ncbi:serine hydrolase [Mesonia aestuariivivens]|uniref:Class A beta-lactamase-related serine hydrolase n=1 Tax=Mesonia aestuariivivens TaxID=2796128 RepID=A0ABS6W640_9FLAO|nr:serine hydrolase [Mesonia aestuariivivens]MBW2962609.1 class A beta-lactamase-related serine hydrolase [Mesonia aestuariivivens]